jgi:catechol 2,3-dioxygenase-like lactoylglutathione lyase family enzyme
MFRSPQVILFSENVPRAVAFYTRLGFSESFRVPKEGEPIHVDLALDDYTIGIASVGSTRDDHGLNPVPKDPSVSVYPRTVCVSTHRRVVGQVFGTERSPSPGFQMVMVN